MGEATNEPAGRDAPNPGKPGWPERARRGDWPEAGPAPGLLAAAGEATHARTLKQDRRSTVRLVDDPADHPADRGGEGGSPRQWVVKTYHLHAVRRAAAARLRQSPAWREFRAFGRLREAGLRVPPCVALVGRPDGDEALVMPYIDAEDLEAFIAGSDDPLARARVARAVGAQAGALLRAGLVNRDHKVSNLLIDASCRESGEPPIIIDPLGLRRRDPVRRGRVDRMWARLLETAVKAGPVSKREIVAAWRAGHPGAGRGELVRQRRRIASAYRDMGGPPL